MLKKSNGKVCKNKINVVPLQPQIRNGTLAERLGNGLQNRVEQFDSARYLFHKRGFLLSRYPPFCLFTPLKVMKRLLSTLFICLVTLTAIHAQYHRILSEDIRSLQVVADNDWQQLPVIRLDDGKIDIDFDRLGHGFDRYTYKIEHCEANWDLSSELFSSDYLSGFPDGNTIDDMVESINTNTPYTHYHLTLPNDQCKMKMSGNYRVSIYKDGEEEPAIEACFMVVEQKASIRMEMTTNTDIDSHAHHQQISMQVGYGPLRITHPQTQIKTVLMQNREWFDARVNVKPQFTMADGLRWEHCRDYIFTGGNEFHKFEILSTDNPSMGIEHVDWDGKNYHAYPYVDAPRHNYLYDESAQGAYILRNSDNSESTYTSDYMDVHFEVKTDAPVPGDLYVSGDWTFCSFDDAYKMTYDGESRSYKLAIPLKLGYYSYQYLMKDYSGRIVRPPFEGSFHETHNTYQSLVYYRAPGDRTDRLVGYATLQ